MIVRAGPYGTLSPTHTPLVIGTTNSSMLVGVGCVRDVCRWRVCMCVKWRRGRVGVGVGGGGAVTSFIITPHTSLSPLCLFAPCTCSGTLRLGGQLVITHPLFLGSGIVRGTNSDLITPMFKDLFISSSILLDLLFK
jgi:hypothetical protein